MINEQTALHGAEDMMRHARWITQFLHSRKSDFSMSSIMVDVKYSSARAGGPALRLADCMWLAHVRQTFPRMKVMARQEEEAFAHLCFAHDDLNKEGLYRVWSAIGSFKHLRVLKLGPPLPDDCPQPELPDTTWWRTHQQAMFRLDFRAREHGLEELWKMVHSAWVIEPNPGMLEALALFSQMVWWGYVRLKGEDVSRNTRLNFGKASNAFWHHYLGNPWLAETPIEGLVHIYNKR